MTLLKKAIRFLFSWLPKKKVKETSAGVPQHVIWQTMLLTEDECLLYIDESKTVHYFTSLPFDPEKTYRIIIMEA